MRSYDASSLAQLLPYPQREANKYTRGKLTLLVGSRTYPGAAGLAALASQQVLAILKSMLRTLLSRSFRSIILRLL